MHLQRIAMEYDFFLNKIMYKNAVVLGRLAK